METVGIRLSEKRVSEYLNKLESLDCAPVTLQSYRRNLKHLFCFLNDDKYIQAGTLAAWQNHLLEAGYSTQTINVCTTTANGLMVYLGHMELQAKRLPKEKIFQPELTRAEYLRLLSAARMLGKERAYLLVKVFGAVGLSVGDVEKLTAEAVRAGEIEISHEALRIPEGLQKELLHFMKEEGIAAGPVFLTKGGKPQGRTVITGMIKSLCRDARVSEEKANPRCLRKLYLTTQAGIRENLSLLAEQSYDRMLELEQNSIGWEAQT